MKEYIDREALIKHLEEEAEECSDDPYLEPVSYGARLGIHGALSFAKTLPTADVVEVVRCKDCRFWDEFFTDPITSYQYGFCNNDKWRDVEGWEQETTGQDFCSYGERKGHE